MLVLDKHPLGPDSKEKRKYKNTPPAMTKGLIG